MVERLALMALPQFSHLRPARAAARAFDRALIQFITVSVTQGEGGVNRYRYTFIAVNIAKLPELLRKPGLAIRI